MLVHIDVRADLDEPFKVSVDQIEAGKAWLDARTAEGSFRICLPYEQTGGFVLQAIPDDVSRVDLDVWLRAFWAPYPLLDTITMTTDVVFGSLDEGFDVLREAHAAGRRVEQPQAITP
jgi:hypothetical protein